MPTIIVLPDAGADDAPTFKFKEWVRTVHLEDAHFRSQLVERIQWAVEDAERDEEMRPRALTP